MSIFQNTPNKEFFQSPEMRKTLREMGAYDELNRYSETSGRLTKEGRENRPSPICTRCYIRNGFHGKTVDGKFICTECLS